MHLQVRGYSVFIDVEKLESGKFEDKLIQSVQRARNFILVLSASALDKCMGDTAMKDWVHKVRGRPVCETDPGVKSAGQDAVASRCSLLRSQHCKTPMIPAGTRRMAAASRKGKPFMKCSVAG